MRKAKQVKEIFTNKLKRGVAVNPLYAGVISNALKARIASGQGSSPMSRTYDDDLRTSKPSFTISQVERSIQKLSPNGLACILDLLTS